MDYNYELVRDLVQSDNNIESVRNAFVEGMDPNITNSEGHTLLHTAARSIPDNPEIVQELINVGVDISRLDNTSYTALHYAVIRRKRKVVDVLLQTGININQKNHQGITALHYAVNRGMCPSFDIFGLGRDIYIIKKLLNHRLINVNETDSYQQAPLAWAIRKNDFEIVKLLLNKDAKVDDFDIFMYTPLDRALDNCHSYIVIALLLKRASLLKIGLPGQTPLNNIIKSQSVKFACSCLKVIAFNYKLEVLLTNKIIPNPELWQFLNNCRYEINYMKSDIITNKLTVFDFFSKSGATHGFDNPIMQIYKPVVDKLLAGKYPVYLGYILNRMSKSTLYTVLEVYINEKYFNKFCAMKHFEEFLKIIQIHLLYEYLSNQGIFYTILAFTNKTEIEHLLNFYEHEWYLTDLWDVYPSEHFY